MPDHVRMYTIISHHLNTVAVTKVRITTTKLFWATFIIKNISTYSKRNWSNFDAHLPHKSVKEVKWKQNTVDLKLQLLLKKNNYVRLLFTTHIAISNFCSSNAIRRKYEAKFVCQQESRIHDQRLPIISRFIKIVLIHNSY